MDGDEKWLKNFGSAVTQKDEKIGWTLVLQDIVEFVNIPYTYYNTRM